jgi:hypothetical protein
MVDAVGRGFEFNDEAVIRTMHTSERPRFISTFLRYKLNHCARLDFDYIAMLMTSRCNTVRQHQIFTARCHRSDMTIPKPCHSHSQMPNGVRFPRTKILQEDFCQEMRHESFAPTSRRQLPAARTPNERQAMVENANASPHWCGNRHNKLTKEMGLG